MSTDYLPRTDAELLVWAMNFNTQAAAGFVSWGVESAKVDAVEAAANSFQTALNAQTAAQAAVKQATQNKNDKRAEFETAVRAFVRELQANPTVTEAQKAALGLTVADKTATPSGTPDTRPVATIDTSQRLQHTVSWRDESTPTSAAKPSGVMGCEIWVKIDGTAPVDETDARFLALDTATPYVANYGAAEAGKTAHYILRWVSKGGDKGPWSAVVSATVVS